MVSKFTNDDVELSDLIGGLKLIKVNTFEVTASNADELMAKAKSIDIDLIRKKWDRIVKTKSKGEIANVYIKTAGDEEFVGLTVVAIATSAPEFAVTVSAALRGQSSISVGTISFKLNFALGLYVV